MAKLNDKVNELRKKMILESAGKYFYELGYDKMSIDKVARELSVGVGTIYSLFPSKEDLFYAWIESIVETANNQLCNKQIINSVEKLKWFVEYKISYYEKYKNNLRNYLYNNKLVMGEHNPLRKMYIYIGEALKDICEEGADVGLLAHIMDGIVNCYIENSNGNLIAQKGEIVSMLLRVINYEK